MPRSSRRALIRPPTRSALSDASIFFFRFKAILLSQENYFTDHHRHRSVYLQKIFVAA